MITSEQDWAFMGCALEYALQAGAEGEVPIGAVLVSPDGAVLAAAGNRCIGGNDPTGHAEIHVLRAAAQKMGNYRLPGTVMYATLEPCPMCAAAMIQARVERIVFGAADPKAGGIQSVYRIGSDGCLNHRFVVAGGVRAEECSRLLKEFFRRRRQKNAAPHFFCCQKVGLRLKRAAREQQMTAEGAGICPDSVQER